MKVNLSHEDFERKMKDREVMKYARHSYTGLVQVLKKYIDFNEDRLNSTLFEYACATLDREKKPQSDYNIQFFMRLKMMDIIDKSFNFYQEKQNKELLECMESDIEKLVDYEHKFGKNSCSAWKCCTKETAYAD